MKLQGAVILAAFLLTAGTAIAPQVLVAQATGAGADSSVVVRLRDGSTVVGRVTRQTADSVELTMSAGRLTLSRATIASMVTVATASLHDGRLWAPNPHYSRLFFGPTGRTLDRGEGYFSDFELFFLNVAWGVTDRITLGGGLSVFPSGDFSDNVYYFSPKVAVVRSEDFNVSAGALIGFAGHVNGSAGLLYLTASNGSRDNAFTYGVGWAYSDGKVSGDATVMLGGTFRLGRRVALMSENYVFAGGGRPYVLPMYGVRFLGDNISGDVGFANFFGPDVQGIFPGVPWIGFAVKF